MLIFLYYQVTLIFEANNSMHNASFNKKLDKLLQQNILNNATCQLNSGHKQISCKLSVPD